MSARLTPASDIGRADITRPSERQTRPKRLRAGELMLRSGANSRGRFSRRVHSVRRKNARNSGKLKMSVFGAYSQYYDLLYKDKDYRGEADYVCSLIERHHPGARAVLDLGCGTGRHALLLAENGYRMTGVDRSPEMLATANAQLASADSASAARLASSGAAPEFREGDVRSVRVGQRFDVVVSLFHVMSYQTSNADLQAAFR